MSVKGVFTGFAVKRLTGEALALRCELQHATGEDQRRLLDHLRDVEACLLKLLPGSRATARSEADPLSEPRLAPRLSQPSTLH